LCWHIKTRLNSGPVTADMTSTVVHSYTADLTSTVVHSYTADLTSTVIHSYTADLTSTVVHSYKLLINDVKPVHSSLFTNTMFPLKTYLKS